jgi:hypothetical protein
MSDREFEAAFVAWWPNTGEWATEIADAILAAGWRAPAKWCVTCLDCGTSVPLGEVFACKCNQRKEGSR